MLNELGRIVHDNPRSTVAVFTHADPIRLALAHYGGAHIDLFQRLVVHPASVSAAALGGIDLAILFLRSIFIAHLFSIQRQDVSAPSAEGASLPPPRANN